MLLWALGAGLVGMALWRLSEAAFGVTGKDGHKAKKRLPAAARCVFYAFVAYSVLAFAAGSGGGGSSDRQSRDVTARVMEMPAGRWLVGAAGVAIVVAGVVIGVQALRRTYRKKMKLGGLSPAPGCWSTSPVSAAGRPAASCSPRRAPSPYGPHSPTNPTGRRDWTTPSVPSPAPRSGPGSWPWSPRGWCCSASSRSSSPACGGSEPPGTGNTGRMNEHEIPPPDGRPVDVYLDLLRVRMASDDYQLLLSVVEPVLQAIDEQQMPTIDFSLDGDSAEALPQEIRDEAALVIATAVTGRLDNEVVEISTDETGPVRVVTDATTASDPERLGEIADYLKERHQQNEELRGIAEASGLPSDF